ncbi:MAG TPA: hypothetical protein EYP56_13020, partial [Planctomycetaceae bacterium]|nr:hypothetical protein [Planctomycetaceae bacterium]
MDRRGFLAHLGGDAVAALLGFATRSNASGNSPAAMKRFLLSSSGCGRATGYAETNKIVTFDGKTHVAWLDSASGKFLVRVRTLDRRSGQWSPVYTVGEAVDNHGGPALTVDSGGFLHIVYHPHHHPFRYRRSVQPNEAAEWTEELRFGKRCTYPTLLCGADDTLYLTCRESDREPWVVNLYTKPPGRQWQGPRPILQADVPGYAHFQEALAWGPDHRTLHLSCRIHDGNPRQGYRNTVGYLYSTDSGHSWRRDDGREVQLPATTESITVIEKATTPTQRERLRCGAIAVDRSGKPYILYSVDGKEAIIASLDADGQWQKLSVLEHTSERSSLSGVTLPGGIVVGEARIFLALTTGRAWGGPNAEVVWLQSADSGRAFAWQFASKVDPNVA